ncbi:MAG TPA: BTAD domain-containing putative transcriptional regulator [Gaiella sp.]|uniref:BTAD domain-containing putative transcriptional regulator n=1 Tax=Gaiella sp. TaxID=2663207 RepID=UPI002D7E3A99|nr:BTAD domain-containing putative transcriptional regulator [Gaiella sp.]HET9287079.1 BTAD domain-containing putative transcriptional regulator [Gaiella sp.]
MQEFRILGPLEVRGDHGPITLGGPRQRALLAALLLRAGRVVPTEQLVDELYGAEPPPTATASLQNAVVALRKALGPDVLVTRPPGYLLAIAPDQIDARRFEQVLTDARRASVTERRDLLVRALGLWRGPPLAEFAYEEWAQTEARRLEELRLVGTEERIATDVELSRAAEVVPELQSLVDEHPLRERLRELLMLALYRAGRQAEALDAYAAARAALDELGIEPGEGLQRLQAAILRHEAGLSRKGNGDHDSDAEIVKAIVAGRVVPVLGLDGGQDLAQQLALAFGYPADRPPDLARVSQYVATMNGSGPLYDELHRQFEAAADPQPVHRFLATLPPLLRDRGAPHQLVISTRYDLALERAFEMAGEEIDVVTYVATGPYRGKFWHRPPGEEPRPIDVPNTYATELSLERRTVLLKLHGAVDPFPDREWESFVITEDDYIDYLGRSDLVSSVPVALAAHLRRSHFLFIGYEMVDWNLRLVMHRVWGDRPLAYRSWALDPEPTALEQAFWRRFDVDVLDVEPDAYVGLLGRRLETVA